MAHFLTHAAFALPRLAFGESPTAIPLQSARRAARSGAHSEQ
jgi:hypothetical protein